MTQNIENELPTEEDEKSMPNIHYKIRQPYKLKETIGNGDDFRLKDGTPWVEGVMCRVCGHHLPINQVVKIGEWLTHSDVAICLALIVKSGSHVQKYYPQKDADAGKTEGDLDSDKSTRDTTADTGAGDDSPTN